MASITSSEDRVSVPSGPRPWFSVLLSDNMLRWIMPAPAVLVLVIFTVIPLVQTIYYGFNDLAVKRKVIEFTWTGLENYQHILESAVFGIALKNTLIFTLVAVLGELFLGYVIALLLYGEMSRWRAAFRVMFMIPMVLSPVVVGITWRALLNPSFGWFNHLLGITGTEWLSDPDRALFVLAAVDIWQWTPFMFVIILSGLQGLSIEIMEAARVDGASSGQMFTRIIWPLMLPITTVAVLLRAIDAFKVFDLVFNLTYGGPGTSTETLSFHLYRLGFVSRDYGEAAAASVLLSIVVGVLVTIYVRFARRAMGGNI